MNYAIHRMNVYSIKIYFLSFFTQDPERMRGLTGFLCLLFFTTCTSTGGLLLLFV